MVPPPSQADSGRRRLQTFAAEWGIANPAPPAPLQISPTARTANDERTADELLRRRRESDVQAQGPKPGIRRAFTVKKKGWSSKEIYDALEAHVAAFGSPAVAEALVDKLRTAGGDVNVAAAARSRLSLLRGRRPSEPSERGRILQKAIENKQPAMVAVLAPYADPSSLDSSLPAAMRSGSADMVALLLRHGAKASQTADGQDAFLHVCMYGGQADVVALILASDGRPPPNWVSKAMINAAKKGCLDTVLHLSRSTADGNYKKAAALKEAIAKCRVDVVLAILTGTNPPTSAALNEAFNALFSHPTIMPNDKMALADILLCAGADGAAVAEALVQACQTGFSEMVSLLVSHGASLEYDNAAVLRSAIALAKVDLVRLLLTDRSALSPIYATECLGHIPKQIKPEDRHTLLTLLLRKGAGGDALSECLVDAIKADDLESVNLMLRPLFPDSRPAQGRDRSTASWGRAYDRHHTASVNWRDGLAVQHAVMAANLPILQVLLSAQPSAGTLGAAFQYIDGLPPQDRYRVAEPLLSAGATGPSVHQALQKAVGERPPKRDKAFIDLLLEHNADPNFNGGSSIAAAIALKDVPLLTRLLRKKTPTAESIKTAITAIMAVPSPALRADIMCLLLDAGAAQGEGEVAKALISVLRTQPTDMRLLNILLRQGTANINYKSGMPVKLAAQIADPQVLRLLVETETATPESLSCGLHALFDLETTPAKAEKVDILLRRPSKKEDLNTFLVVETEAVLKMKPDEGGISILKLLLANGADVDANGGKPLCRAVEAANARVADLFFAASPNPKSLAAALPYAIALDDPMDRLTFTKRVLDAGAPGGEVNRVLIVVVQALPDDLTLIRSLIAKADARDGLALLMAVKGGRVNIVESMFHEKYPAAVLNEVLVEAMKGSDRKGRLAMCTLLLNAGASGVAVSDALVAAASDRDLALAALLLQHGASIEHKEGEAIDEACRTAQVDVLRTLLESPAAAGAATLERAFKTAGEIGSFSKRRDILRLLLERGVHGKAVDTQLVSEARHGDDGIELIRLLLEFGASPDFNSGEAVWISTRTKATNILRLMLGLAGLTGKQQKPSQATMKRAMKASARLSNRSKYGVIELLFKAGLETSELDHITLVKAVKEKEPDIELVRLLLQHGASPLSNGSEALVEAAQKLKLAVLEVFLESDILPNDLNWAFSHTFNLENVDSWLLEDGVPVAKALLKKGATGNGPSTAVVVAIDNCLTEKDAVARRFVDLLLERGVDVNFDNGRPLVAAAKLGDGGIVSRLLALKPTTETLSIAFPYIFDFKRTEDEACQLIRLFTEYDSGEDRLDVMFNHPRSEPVVFRALSRHPRSIKVLQALLDGGFYYDKMTMARVTPGAAEDEQVSLLLWALLQPQKRVSSAVIELLIKNGANVNFETRMSKTTPLMVAIRSKRQDVAKWLIQANAAVDIADRSGNTPLAMATRVGGELGAAMMLSVLDGKPKPSKDDGSLHDAARKLNVEAMKILVKHGHNIDFPSPLHGGRSALGEICLNAALALGKTSTDREREMKTAMEYLVKKGTDLRLKSDGKSVLMLALDSSDPVPTTRALLKVGLWKLINERFIEYTKDRYTYSPTMYVTKLLPPTDTNAALLTLLKYNRADDAYYAKEGTQPAGAVGLPLDVLQKEKERKAREDQRATEDEDHKRAMARKMETAQMMQQLQLEAYQIENVNAEHAHRFRIRGMREIAAVEDELSTVAEQREQAKRQALLEHTRALADTEFDGKKKTLELEDSQKQKQLEWIQAANRESVAHDRQLSNMHLEEKKEFARLDREADSRFRARITEQKKLVESATTWASNMAGSGMNRRQVGYIMGELPE